MINYIKDVIKPFGVSGSEEEIREIIRYLITPYVDGIEIDPLGNLIAVKRCNTDSDEKVEKIMFAAHMDTIGVIVTYVDDKGYLRFSNIGGVDAFIANGQRVKFKNGTLGVVYYEEDIPSKKNLKLGKMFIDIGAKSRDEALSMINIGDCAVFDSDCFIQGDNIISSHIDDRIGCAILINAAIRISDMIAEGLIKNKEIYYSFTVQEELGLRGAGPAATNINPDVAVVIDVTDTGDIPGCKPMEVKMGAGPAIKIKDRSVISSAQVVQRLKATADLFEIPYQIEIMEAGGTDAGAIHKRSGGIMTGGVSIPSRYIHTPNEMCSLKDVENAYKLLCEFCRS